MESSNVIESLQLLKVGVNKDLHKSFNNLSNLMQKIRQIEQIIDGPEGTKQNIRDIQEELKSDLYMIKTILLNFDTQCDQSAIKFQSAKFFINDNKWIRYPQYPIPDLKPYVPGYRINCAVSHIKNQAKGLFYLMDLKRSAGFSSVYRMLENGKDLKRIDDPNSLESGDLVAVHIDGQFTRVLIEITATGIYLFMIDIGEELKYDEELELYEMANYYKHLPALALLCKIKDLPKKETARKFLIKHLHQEVEVEVVAVKYNTVHVSFVHLNVDTLLNESVSDVSDLQSNGTVHTNATQYSSTNPFFADLCNDVKILEDSEVNEESNNNKHQEIEEFLAENPTGTSNAMVAVLGYDPKDESRYCKHYNEQTGGCFKGVNCTFIHQKPLQDGWTRDKVLSVADIPEKIPLPEIHQELSIEMCFCDDVNSFYGYILNPEFHRSSAMTLIALNRIINRPDNMKKYKKFNQLLPCEGELVLAPYNSLYYRGRVISVARETADVFFVDYGNISEISIMDLYTWDNMFGQIPFQAIKFRIAGIEPNKGERQNLRANELYKQLSNNTLRGIVLGNTPEVLVRLFGNGNIDIMEILKGTGLAKPLDNLQYQKKTEYLPMM